MNRNISLGASSSPGASPKPGFPGMKAVILAAGFGTRFDPSGRRNKLLHALPDGRPIIRATCENALAVVSDVIVVCHAFRSEMEAALSGLALMTVYCEDAPQGMGASIRCGLGTPPPSEGWLMMLGDMPYVHSNTLLAVAQALHDQDTLIARPFYRNQPGHPVGFRAELTPVLRQCDPRSGLRGVIQSHSATLRRLDLDDPGCISDIDVPPDIREAQGSPD